ncbi:hypothetical protein [Rathayibacter caricis]|nr:hypothetical protein [Rathayibacter caricis]
MKVPGKAVVVVAFALATAGCTSPSAASFSSAASAPSGGASSTAAERLPAAPAPTENVPSTEASASDAEQAPELAVEMATIGIAAKAATAFCRPSLDYDTWIAELYPFLSQHAAVAYETVDPTNVPCTTLTGDATVRDGDGAFTMRILVPTDAGEYSVYVHRTTESTPWAVEQITALASE